MNQKEKCHYYHYILGKVAGNKCERYKIQICVCMSRAFMFLEKVKQQVS